VATAKLLCTNEYVNCESSGARVHEFSFPDIESHFSKQEILSVRMSYIYKNNNPKHMFVVLTVCCT